MRKILFYFITGILFIFLQSSVFPLFCPPDLRPNLILLLVLLAGLREETLEAIVVAMLLGAIQDSFSGHSLGLYVTVYLALVLCARVLSDQLNAESPPLLMLMVIGGTLVQNLLVGVLLSILADTQPVLHILLPAIPFQVLANLFSSMLLISMFLKVRRLFGYRRGLSGLISQGKHYGA